MYFVIDNQPPIIAGEKREMWKILFTCLMSISTRLLFGIRTPVCEYLVGADCNRTNFFTISRILTYHLWRDIRLIENFLYPLPHSDRIGRKNQCSALNIGHGE